MMSGIIAGARPGPVIPAVTWNPVNKGDAVLSGGNLIATASGIDSTNYGNVRSTISATGKKYFEVKVLSVGSDYQPGIGISNYGNPGVFGDNEFGGYANNIELRANGSIYKNGVVAAISIGQLVAGDIVMIAFNAGGQRFWVGKNGTWIGNPAAGTGATSTNNVPTPCFAAACCGPNHSQSSLQAYFKNFNYAPPAGFTAF